MKTIKQIANAIVKSDKSLQVNREKNYQLWAQNYLVVTQFENPKLALKELKNQLISLGANQKTVETRLSFFNTATKNGISILKVHSFQQLELANKKIKSGEAKSVDGVVKDIPSVNAEKMQNAEVIKAKNENELTMILANAEFKKFKNEFTKMGWDFANLKKALLQK